MTLKKYRLKVRELSGSDTYKDMVRVYWDERGGINNGAIARVTPVGGQPFLLAMRGCLAKDRGKLKWARQSADPGARIAAWIAIVSGVIGLIGLILGIIGAYPTIKEIVHDLLKLFGQVDDLIV